MTQRSSLSVGLAVALVVAGGAAVLFGAPVVAQPPGPTLFCEHYADAPACSSGDVSCTTCHVSPPALNVYGEDVAAALAPGEARPLHVDLFTDRLVDALIAVEGVDSDLDSYSNLEEILAGTSPADAASSPAPDDCADDDGDDWDVCGYDADYAYKRVLIDFCGRSPTLTEKEAFAAASDRRGALHDALDECLDSEHWRGMNGRVWNLANNKINPTLSIKSGIDAGPIPLADYDDDYAYFVWTQTDGRDTRLLLTGQNFVTASYVGGATVYDSWNRSPIRDLEERGYDRFQAVVEERRAGMLTHRWFLAAHTMFTAVPRTTAAQAYRAYLGYDIARLEGLSPVVNEPADYDQKGVQAEGCAACHSTLDPMSYPFSRYEGIGNAVGFDNQYEYNEDRMSGFVRSDGEGVLDTPEQGFLLGEPVDDLVAWAQVAANSEAFRRSRVSDYWEMLLGEPPRANEQAEFGALAAGLASTWSIEAMLHDLIDTEAYGAP
jgi:hypothetical protein